jgi:hypothetical protein
MSMITRWSRLVRAAVGCRPTIGAVPTDNTPARGGCRIFAPPPAQGTDVQHVRAWCTSDRGAGGGTTIRHRARRAVLNVGTSREAGTKIRPQRPSNTLKAMPRSGGASPCVFVDLSGWHREFTACATGRWPASTACSSHVVRLLSVGLALARHSCQQFAYFRLSVAPVATERADGAELARFRPPCHGLGVDAKHRGDLRRSQ